MEKIIIYTQDTCGYCKTIKEELTKNEIKFENRFTKDFESEWQTITSLTGMPSVPTIYYKDSYLVPARDFPNAQALISILQNFKELDFDDARQALERVKTLNYNMLTAFNRLDQLLRQIETKINKEDEHESTD